jgi:glyoxylase-like metal-dependent hydrolase (beta-lactamase superfamily II)
MPAIQIIALALSMGSVFLLPIPPRKGGGYLMVDTGYDRDYPLFHKRLAARSIDPKEIKAVFLTHHHDDHAGFLNDIKRDSGCAVIMSRMTASLLPSGRNDVSRGGFWINGRIQALARLKARVDRNWTLGFPPYIPAADDIVFDPEGGEGALLSFGIEARVLATPGHCVDHQVLVLPDGSCLAGDAAAAMLLWAGTRHFPVFMTDLEEAYRDWEAILAAGATRIVPSHGKPFPARVLVSEKGRVLAEDTVPFAGL